MDAVVSLVLALLPVMVFLVALVIFDSYKLVPLNSIWMAIVVGCVVALVCKWINPPLADALNISLTKLVGPFNEELFKGLFLVYLIRSKRIAFMVDGWIYGFAIGAGFAIVENVDYFRVLEGAGWIVWMVRGFGTAIMHGGVTAIMGIVSVSLASRYGSDRLYVYIPGLLIAAVLHSLYNQIPDLPFVSEQFVPFVMTVTVLIGLGLVITIVFRLSEKATRDWLGVRFDTDTELLEMINTGKALETRVGEYLTSLLERFPGEVVADMLCMLRIHLELSVRGKGILLMQEAGFKYQPDPDVEERLIELKFLEKSIGKTGLLAVSPILNMTDKELWQLHYLGKH